ncbi:MAG: type IIL restriction-modification enzyme MmeI, partial [Microcystis panniformis]
NILFQKYQLKIHFAHRTFKWSNEAKGTAAVHCIIIGFASFNITNKILFDYEDIQGESLVVQSNNINPYLVDGSDIIISNRSFPLSNVPLMRFGSMPRDGGNFIFTEPEKEEFLKLEPKAEKWIKPYTGAQEFINGYSRYCLWLVDISPGELKTLLEVIKRVDRVKNFRLKSKAAATRKFAATPTLFCQIAQPETNYLLVPRVSSERRKYIPIGFMNKNVIGNDQVLLIPNANLYLFGILTSEMHMAWVKYVCGRLESRFRYSNTIVYNNYPFPENITDKQKQTVET